MNMLSLAPLALGGLLTVYALDGIIRKGLLKEKAAVQYNQKSDARMGRILGRMDSVLSGYAPTFWAHGSYTQLGLLLLWKAVHNNTVRFKTHTVQCPDGGVVHIEEFVEPEGATELPVNAPIVLILHTIGGTAADESEFCKEAYARGMRAMVLARRGHAAPLVTAKFNFMGCTKDTTLMVQRVKQLYPESFIGMVGLSAGSGQCVSYIGQQGDTQPVQAAVSLCPAYDISKAFHKFQEQSPLLAKWLLQGLKKFFLRNNYTLMKATHEDSCKLDAAQ
ncbi:hypothetical protein SARC_10696 [Sphaeroforma arctica JP610]|uniref:Serine aminopeptidase S33 domain-containing protein n=1 Tax=Sphaeroforma arctica JP610 TaxID=667725 RepID=A0A0L0FJ66_9EUKA|nr:hypothetical protein SARC_10696 [Sphaeroforma arctica JP610]KNC76822.1 hypothetical protein SARC_10696 [Sphaeroforma arctica JP610]|eukprot:XP_014150724.1 hypothetical protein SARC_10696 [Sphaeroforma arctica JP610]